MDFPETLLFIEKKSEKLFNKWDIKKLSLKMLTQRYASKWRCCWKWTERRIRISIVLLWVKSGLKFCEFSHRLMYVHYFDVISDSTKETKMFNRKKRTFIFRIFFHLEFTKIVKRSKRATTLFSDDSLSHSILYDYIVNNVFWFVFFDKQKHFTYLK